jgi:hypothetical protein
MEHKSERNTSNPTMKNLLLTTTIAGAVAASAMASDITWQTPTTISGASDVSTQGNFFGSWAPGDDAYNPDTLPVNGVTFNAYGSLPGLGASGSYLDHYTGYNNPGTANANYNTILQAAVFNWNPDPINVSWNGMTVGDTYLVELWVQDGRNATVNARTLTVTGGANTSAPLALGSGNSGPGQFILGTFVADASGAETISLTPGAGGYGAQINLLQVRDITVVPEPSTIALLVAGAGLMICSRRRGKG